MDERARRIAENESRFRLINERLEADVRAVAGGDDPVEFVCECGDMRCTAAVPLTLAEYERVRDDSRTFAVVPGHEIEDVEDVIGRDGRYHLIRKDPETWPVVDRTDPRTP
jgi:hypothetical protein